MATTLAASPVEAQTYRLASEKAIRGFQKVSLTDGTTVYLGDTVAHGAKSCSTHSKSRDHACAASALALSDQSAARVAVSVQRTGADLIAGTDNTGVTELSAIASVGVDALILGNTRAVEQVRDDVTPVVSLRSSATTVSPGDAVDVDVYVSGADQLRTFQVSVEATGGTSGSLDRVSNGVDSDREDYVFSTIPSIDAADQVHGRVGATTIGGSVNATDAQYVGTFSFVASRDASGTFNFTIRPLHSFLNDEQAQDLQYRTTASAVQVAPRKSQRVTR